MKLVYYVVVLTIFSYNLANTSELDEKLKVESSSGISMKDRQTSPGEIQAAVGADVEDSITAMLKREKSKGSKVSSSTIDADVEEYTSKLEGEKSKGSEASPSLIEYYQEYLDAFKILQGKIKSGGDKVDISKERFTINEKHNMYAGGFL